MGVERAEVEKSVGEVKGRKERGVGTSVSFEMQTGD